MTSKNNKYIYLRNNGNIQDRRNGSHKAYGINEIDKQIPSLVHFFEEEHAQNVVFIGL